MEPVPPSSSAPPSSHSASNSENSASNPITSSPPKPQHDDQTNNGVLDAPKNDDQTNNAALDTPKDKFEMVDDFEDSDSDSDEYEELELEKWRKHEAEFAHRLIAKYFSNKDIYGGGLELDLMQTQCRPSRTREVKVPLLKKPLQLPQTGSILRQKEADDDI